MGADMELVSTGPNNQGRVEYYHEKTGIVLVNIPGGTFWMGSKDGRGDEDEHPRHQVRISGFCMAKYPLTWEQYGRFCEATGGAEPSRPDWFASQVSPLSHPVVNISWDDASAYAEWAGLRLPTEAEWEYACRAGSTKKRYGKLDDIAWHAGNSNNRTHEVGQKLPNAWGLHDTLGNVWEWVEDRYDERTYNGRPLKVILDPVGSSTGSYRVVRGGSWSGGAGNLRAASRGRGVPSYRYGGGGVRLAMSWPEEADVPIREDQAETASSEPRMISAAELQEMSLAELHAIIQGYKPRTR